MPVARTGSIGCFRVATCISLQRDRACELVASSHWLVLLPPKRPCRVLTDLRGNRLLDLGNTQGGQPLFTQGAAACVASSAQNGLHAEGTCRKALHRQTSRTPCTDPVLDCIVDCNFQGLLGWYTKTRNSALAGLWLHLIVQAPQAPHS